MTTTAITFDKHDYTPEVLEGMEDSTLLTLRNLVAENLGVARIKSFKDHKQAVDTTWKALDKWNNQEDVAPVDVKPKSKKKAKEPKEPLPPAKTGFVQTVKRPTRSMFSRLTKIKEHPGKGHRIRRWSNYKDGMTLLECSEGDEMTPLDVGYYVQHGLMSLTEATEEEFQTGLSEWYKKHGMKNPAEEKAAKKAERDEAKATKTAEREATKAEKAKAKAEKAEAAAKAKAAKEKAAADAKAKAAKS